MISYFIVECANYICCFEYSPYLIGDIIFTLLIIFLLIILIYSIYSSIKEDKKITNKISENKYWVMLAKEYNKGWNSALEKIKSCLPYIFTLYNTRPTEKELRKLLEELKVKQ